MGLCYKLKTVEREKNQEHELYIDSDKNAACICIVLREDGKFKEQIDFDCMDKEEFQELYDYMTMVKSKISQYGL